MTFWKATSFDNLRLRTELAYPDWLMEGFDGDGNFVDKGGRRCTVVPAITSHGLEREDGGCCVKLLTPAHQSTCVSYCNGTNICFHSQCQIFYSILRKMSLLLWFFSSFHTTTVPGPACQSQSTGGKRVRAHADCWTTKTVPEADSVDAGRAHG